MANIIQQINKEFDERYKPETIIVWGKAGYIKEHKQFLNDAIRRVLEGLGEVYVENIMKGDQIKTLIEVEQKLQELLREVKK